MNIVAHILLGSGKLLTFSEEIRRNFDEAIPVITQKIPAKNVDVIIYDNPEGAAAEQGIGGYCPNAHTIYISLDPSSPDLQRSIERELKRTLAYEQHHTLHWQNSGYGKTLLDAMITEGLDGQCLLSGSIL